VTDYHPAVGACRSQGVATTLQSAALQPEFPFKFHGGDIMSLIMRWFYDDGERHRAFFRQRDTAEQKELVIASRDWEHAAPAPPDSRLEDMSEDRLVTLARSWRSSAPARS
jgi:hypothetical protein